MKKIATLLLVLVSLTVTSCDDTTSNTKTATSVGNIKHVNAQAFKKAMDAKTGIVIDVRTPGEFAQGHIKGSKNIDAMNGNFAREFSKLDKKIPVLIYCKSGGRSSRAANKLKRMGFSVYNMQGGFMGWSMQGLPTNKN